MKRIFLLAFILSGCAVLSPLQKGRFITISNLIETGKYQEAKEVIEGMTSDENNARWPKTWYMKGNLCQTAYLDGVAKNDKKLQEIYPDQLSLAFESYEKALSLDERGKVERDIAPKYVILANLFQKIGEAQFKTQRYNESLKAFETALKITKSTFLSIDTDQNLVYNTALAAYESKNWDKAIGYLNSLHQNKYSVNATQLLYEANLEKGDTLSAKNVLIDGIKMHNENEDLVLLLVDLLYKQNDAEGAIQALDRIIALKPLNYTFHYTKGLIYQKMGQNEKAIESYNEALKHAPDELMLYVNIATSYYNTGVAIEEKTITLTNNRLVQEEKTKSAAAFEKAILWLDKIYGKEIKDQGLTLRIYELYKALRVTDKAKAIENQIR